MHPARVSVRSAASTILACQPNFFRLLSDLHYVTPGALYTVRRDGLSFSLFEKENSKRETLPKH
jgi:hypothetical protein